MDFVVPRSKIIAALAYLQPFTADMHSRYIRIEAWECKDGDYVDIYAEKDGVSVCHRVSACVWSGGNAVACLMELLAVCRRVKSNRIDLCVEQDRIKVSDKIAGNYKIKDTRAGWRNRSVESWSRVKPKDILFENKKAVYLWDYFVKHSDRKGIFMISDRVWMVFRSGNTELLIDRRVANGK